MNDSYGTTATSIKSYPRISTAKALAFVVSPPASPNSQPVKDANKIYWWFRLVGVLCWSLFFEPENVLFFWRVWSEEEEKERGLTRAHTLTHIATRTLRPLTLAVCTPPAFYFANIIICNINILHGLRVSIREACVCACVCADIKTEIRQTNS